jgi:hypothetical protein
VGPRAGLDGCEICCRHRDSIPGLSGPQRVAIPTEQPCTIKLATVLCISYVEFNQFRDITQCIFPHDSFFARTEGQFIKNYRSHVPCIPLFT